LFEFPQGTGIYYAYDVKITPPWSRPYSKKDTELYLEVMDKWKAESPEVVNKYAWSFNGNNMMWSTQNIARFSNRVIQIPGETKEKSIFLPKRQPELYGTLF